MAVAPPILPTESEVTALDSYFPLDSSLVDNAMSEGLTFRTGDACIGATGVDLWPVGCAPELIADNVSTHKSVVNWGTDVSFLPFIAYLFVECPTERGVSPVLDARRANELKVMFDASKHRAMARQVLIGDSQITDPTPTPTTNPTLRDNALTPTGFETADDITAVIAKLLDERRKRAEGTVYIHGPWIAVPYLQSLALITAKNGRFEGDGWVYVVDEGYTALGAGPVTDPVGAPGVYRADVAGNIWLYASGRVEYAWGNYIDNTSLGLSNQGVFSAYTVWAMRENAALLRVEQQAFVRFDPCGVIAARATIPV